MMSTCSKFIPNFFNKNKCQNCFKVRACHNDQNLEKSQVSVPVFFAVEIHYAFNRGSKKVLWGEGLWSDLSKQIGGLSGISYQWPLNGHHLLESNWWDNWISWTDQKCLLRIINKRPPKQKNWIKLIFVFLSTRRPFERWFDAVSCSSHRSATQLWIQL